MNYLLSLNKKLVIAVSLVLTLLIILFFLGKFYLSINNETELVIEILDADIIEPKFAINSTNEKIFVTANQGNFIDKDNILLKNDVKFKSKNFSIESDNVIFNRKEQTAQSNNKSEFNSQKTTIYSEGFDIYDNGNKINFNGNVTLVLKWKSF